jgi:hypothetical protein
VNSATSAPTAAEAIAATRAWIEKAVIGLDLCPFAKAVYLKERIRYAVSDAHTSESLLADLERELHALAQADPAALDTTLLIHPHVLVGFLDYNDFLAEAESAVERLGLEGVLQVASFHPQYQFDGTVPDDVTNNTNRSPYPMLHLLRESSVEYAVATFPHTEEIYLKNMETMRRLGAAGWAALDFNSLSNPKE